MGGLQRSFQAESHVLLRELRADPKTAGIRIIMTSAYHGIVEDASRAGAQDAVRCPLRFTEFGEKVERVLLS